MCSVYEPPPRRRPQKTTSSSGAASHSCTGVHRWVSKLLSEVSEKQENIPDFDFWFSWKWKMKLLWLSVLCLFACCLGGESFTFLFSFIIDLHQINIDLGIFCECFSLKKWPNVFKVEQFVHKDDSVWASVFVCTVSSNVWAPADLNPIFVRGKLWNAWKCNVFFLLLFLTEARVIPEGGKAPAPQIQILETKASESQPLAETELFSVTFLFISDKSLLQDWICCQSEKFC